MRVRLIRWPDSTSSTANLRVERWCVSQWEPVMNFELDELRQAHEFALKLSLSTRIPAELAVFEDGQKLSGDPV